MKTTTKTDKSIGDAGGSQPRPRDQGHDRTSSEVRRLVHDAKL